MPRSSGTMTIVNSFTPSTVISSSQVNANFTDIAAEITNSLALDGQSTMTGQIKSADGTVSAPGISFGGDLDTGFFRSAANTFIAVTSSGTVIATFSATGINATGLSLGGSTVAIASRSIASGNGLTGGGDLSADRTLAVGAGEGISVSADAVAVDTTLLRGYLVGLGLSNNGSDATNDIDLAVGAAIDDTYAKFIKLASALTKRLDAAWAVGTNQGGLDTGSIANTTYHVWLIKRSDTGVVDVLFSTSASSPTMPASYDYKRRIGSIMRESGAIVAFVQSGDHFWRQVPSLDVDTTNPGTSAVTATLKTPVGIASIAIVAAASTNAGLSNVTGLITSLSQTDSVPSTSLFNFGTDDTSGSGYHSPSNIHVLTNTSSQIRYRMTSSGASTVIRIITQGWIDRRGRDD